MLLFDVDTEAALLGSILIDPDRLWEVRSKVDVADFYKSSNRILYRIMCDLVDKNISIDLMTVDHEIKIRDTDDMLQVGDVVDLFNCVPTSMNIMSYASVISDLGLKRRIKHALEKSVGFISEPEKTGREALADTIGLIIGTDSKRQVNGDIKEVGLRTLDVIEQRSTGTQHLISTGFDGLDDLLKGGLENTNLVYLGGRPGMGKTSLLTAMSIKMAKRGLRVMSVNNEMTPEQLFMRMLSYESGISFSQLRQGYINDRVYRVAAELSLLPIHMPGRIFTLSQLEAECRVIQATKGLDVLMIDYIQLMNPDGKSWGRYQDVSNISNGLKQLTLNLDALTIAAAQLSRASDKRQDKRPTKEDLKESGDLEQDADVIWLLHSDTQETYGQKSVRRELITDKNRNGPTGTIDLSYTLETMRFDSSVSVPISSYLK